MHQDVLPYIICKVDKKRLWASNANVTLTLSLQHIALYLQTQKLNMLTTVYVRQKLWWIFFSYLLYILGVLFLFSHGEYELCCICISGRSCHTMVNKIIFVLL